MRKVTRSVRRRRVRNPRGQGGRLRNEIVDAAIRLLASAEDQPPLSLRAVAREIGVAPQSVYLQFKTKSELLLAVVATLFAELQRHMDRMMAGHTDPRARLRAHCLAYCDYGLSSPGHYRLLFISRLASQLGIGYQGSPGSRVFEDLVETVRPCVKRRSVAHGGAMGIAMMLWTGLHGIVSLRWSKPGFPWPAVETQVDRLLEGFTLR